MEEAVATPRSTRAAKRDRVQRADQVLLCEALPGEQVYRVSEPDLYRLSSLDHGVIIALQNGDNFCFNLPCCGYRSWMERQMCPLANTCPQRKGRLCGPWWSAIAACANSNASRPRTLVQAATRLCSRRGTPSRRPPSSSMSHIPARDSRWLYIPEARTRFRWPELADGD